MFRRQLLALAFLAAQTCAQLPVHGKGAESTAVIDAAMQQLLKAESLPGACLAICYQGRLVYEKGFGYAEFKTRTPMQAQSRMRIASISKPLTAVAILQLVEKGRLRLSDKVYDILRPSPYGERQIDPRFKQITILQLLQHTAGFDRGASFDPMFRSQQIAEVAGVPEPPGQHEIIRYMAGRPLDFDPGTRYAYSNFGYCLLGRVIERKTGLGYAEYMRQKVFAPLGMDSLAIGRSLLKDRLPGEVFYHTPVGRAPRSVFAFHEGKPKPWPYGGFFLESMDSHGAWISSARDLLRLGRDFDDPQASKLLQPESIQKMFAPPPPPPGHQGGVKPSRQYYGCGWLVQQRRGGRTMDHGGSLPGTASKLVLGSDSLHWALLLNSRHRGAGPRLNTRRLERSVWQAIAAVKAWPAHDLFASAPQQAAQARGQGAGK